MLAYKNRKRLEDTLAEYVCKVYSNNEPFNTNAIAVAIDFLKTLDRCPFGCDEDDDDMEEHEDAEVEDKCFNDAIHAVMNAVQVLINEEKK